MECKGHAEAAPTKTGRLIYRLEMARKKTIKTIKKNTTFLESLGLNFYRDERLRFGVGIILFIIGVLMFIAFTSYFTTCEADQSLVTSLQPGEVENPNKSFQNICGSLGAIVSHFLISRCFGIAAYVIPIFIILVGLKLTRSYNLSLVKWFFALAVIMIWCSVAFAKFLPPLFPDSVFNPGGDHGLYICNYIENMGGTPSLIGLLVIVALAFLVYLSAQTIYTVQHILNPSKFLHSIPLIITNRGDNNGKSDDSDKDDAEHIYDDPEAQVVQFAENGEMNVVEPKYKEEDFGRIRTPKREDKKEDNSNFEIQVGEEEARAQGKRVSNHYNLSTPLNPHEPFTSYRYPTLDLLKAYENDSRPYIDERELRANKEQIEKVLNSFNVQIREIRATVGPTITLYEITPAEGVRISRIRNLEDDIALSLAALGIRIIAPIPGKGTIGIEVPNAKPNIVSMRSILDSKKFQVTKMDLPIALGKTITNEVFMVDLAKIPHLLVAGATGQGKSVGLNAIITSLLYKKHPNELKFVLIDPKKVEFSIYTPIVNHFMAQVPTENDDEEAIITDVTKVIKTLNSLCKLMDHRYDLLKAAGARNIKEYNKKFVERKLRLTDGHDYMPYIVVIIDEFGDLIMTAGKEIELPIARIAQLARAVGIHMVIATQRPTTRIITGNIKANFPGRIAFKTSARIDSMTILDQTGANQLIGRGDMLYVNGGEPTRVQCAFVDTPEVEKINHFIEEQPGPVEPMELPEPTSDEGGGDGGTVDVQNLDPLFEEAARHIVLTQQGSTSMIQRRFSIGYNRAGRLMDQLQEAGIVGEAMGSKPREVLITDPASLDNLFAAMHR